MHSGNYLSYASSEGTSIKRCRMRCWKPWTKNAMIITSLHNLEQILDSPKASNATSGGNGTEKESVYYNSQQQRVSNGVNRVIKGALEANVVEILRGSVDIPDADQFRNISKRVVGAVL
ncbi:unnamed protein product [Allacma fusca]|uniref:Uncharacterized protein n=1 Tax=Allacma fusca TaxID=39272 RepID=A0A8J2J6C6_9HEXA|nr:unnamed protein product [Allacma fusca]